MRQSFETNCDIDNMRYKFYVAYCRLFAFHILKNLKTDEGNFAAGSKEKPFSGKTEVVGGDRNLTSPALEAVDFFILFYYDLKFEPYLRTVGRLWIQIYYQ